MEGGPARDTRAQLSSPVRSTVPHPSECPTIPYAVGVTFHSSRSVFKSLEEMADRSILIVPSSELSPLPLMGGPTPLSYDADRLSGYSGLNTVNPSDANASARCDKSYLEPRYPCARMTTGAFNGRGEADPSPHPLNGAANTFGIEEEREYDFAKKDGMKFQPVKS